jgi:hypothetical protein
VPFEPAAVDVPFEPAAVDVPFEPAAEAAGYIHTEEKPWIIAKSR